MKRRGILAAGNMLVDHVHQIAHWPQPGWLVEIEHSERASGGAPLNVLLTLARMQTGLPLAAIGLIGCDADGDYLLQMLEQHQVEHRGVQRNPQAMTAMTQVMTEPGGQRTFFHAPGANRLLDLAAFERVNSEHKIFHLGYLLLLDSLDRSDAEFGTRSARLLAQMQQRGYHTSLDLVSRQGDPRYRPLVLPALRWLDYLVINELEAGEFTGLVLRAADGTLQQHLMAQAAEQLMNEGVRRRVVIHCPEGAYGLERNGAARWQPSWPLDAAQIVGSVGAGDAFCAGVLYASHENWPLEETLQLAHTCARFNLLCANAIDGARPLAELMAYITLNNSSCL
ncbi:MULTISPECIES: carbohydrate kinase family protein [unclassified Serratia (in: enterobacteria)]|uniref:carbohydrate kinase family protein n=1 Tax=unclassified Serratia (in: enterobacteria) TaxID=2647522 RepID=UPI0005042CE0|nr:MULTISPECIES: carbohydrate kinase family protein [unclassified Serratia (in: enterobacteria)]KFK97647.1 sugar kinase [Serratia sp. Ag2]KFK97998.1 sugar kinase [Serratia sp. Ag1]